MTFYTAAPSTEQEPMTVLPLVNIRENENDIVLEAEMPGLSKESISLDLKGDELTISGERANTALPDGYTALRSERPNYRFRRTFILGTETERSGIGAAYEQGILTVTIPRSKERQPRKIEIKS